MVRFAIILILGIISMETLAVPLSLEVSIKGAQNGNTTEQTEGCDPAGVLCKEQLHDCDSCHCCPGLTCYLCFTGACCQRVG